VSSPQAPLSPKIYTYTPKTRSVKQKKYKGAGGETHVPNNPPYRTHLKYKSRLGHALARPCLASPQNWGCPFLHRIYYLQKPGVNQVGKRKRKAKKKKKMPTTSHTSLVGVLYLRGCGSAGLVSSKNIKITKWRNYCLVPLCSWTIFVRNIQENTSIRDSTKKLSFFFLPKTKNPHGMRYSFLEVGWGDLPGPIPTSYPARHLPPIPSDPYERHHGGVYFF